MKTMGRKERIDWGRQPLGMVSDVELAEILGVHSSAVRRQRTKRGIPKSRQPKRYRRDIIWEFLPLGLFGDKPLATALGVDRKTVRFHRERLGIKPRKPKSRVRWEALGLGTDTDANIGKRFNISSSEVCRHRREFGIPAFDNTFLARVKKEKIPLGTMTDADIARRYHTSEGTAGKTRRDLGIPEYTEPCSVCGKPTRIRNPGHTRACAPCSRLLVNERRLHPDESEKMCILRAKTALLVNLTEEKVLTMKGK